MLWIEFPTPNTEKIHVAIDKIVSYQPGELKVDGIEHNVLLGTHIDLINGKTFFTTMLYEDVKKRVSSPEVRYVC